MQKSECDALWSKIKSDLITLKSEGYLSIDPTSKAVGIGIFHEKIILEVYR